MQQPYLDFLIITVLAITTLLFAFIKQETALVSVIWKLAGAAILLFAPGYAAVTAVYPRSKTANQTRPTDSDTSGQGLSGTERLILSFVVNILFVVSITTVLIFGPWGVNAGTVMVGLAMGGLVLVAVATVRRLTIASEDCPDLRRTTTRTLETLQSEFRLETTAGTVLNVAVVIALIGALTGVGFAVQQQPTGEQYSEYALLAENEAGELTATEYPTELTEGEEVTLYVQVSNHEKESVQYTGVVLLERTTPSDGSQTVTESTELDQFSFRLAKGESKLEQNTISPTFTGDNLRLTYLFYKGESPSDPTRETADESLHLSINVSSTSG